MPRRWDRKGLAQPQHPRLEGREAQPCAVDRLVDHLVGLRDPPPIRTVDEADRVRSAYGVNFDRLVAIKAKYDPDNFFRGNQNVAATVASGA